jgi:hypothetical protein
MQLWRSEDSAYKYVATVTKEMCNNFRESDVKLECVDKVKTYVEYAYQLLRNGEHFVSMIY